MQSALSHHPVRSVFFIVITLIGLFFGLKRFIAEDARKTAVYENHKLGSRLD